ncbi:MAG: hypothetical protein ACAF42_09455 [Limnothrix sp. BL-A-16]
MMFFLVRNFDLQFWCEISVSTVGIGATLQPVSTIATDLKERSVVPVARYSSPIRGVDSR